MPKDRGSIKWVSLMLPEHTEQLKEMWANDGTIEKPMLDEQQAELLNDQLVAAFQQQSPVCLRVYASGRITDVTGKVKKLDGPTNSVILQTKNQMAKRIAFHDILQLTCQ